MSWLHTKLHKRKKLIDFLSVAENAVYIEN